MNERQIFNKCAWHLIPFMVLLYVVSFIDRANVGFAALTMNKDLGFSPAVYGFGAGLFFVSYALFQVPANVILARGRAAMGVSHHGKLGHSLVGMRPCPRFDRFLRAAFSLGCS